MQGLHAKHHGPTNHRQSRITVYGSTRGKTYAWDYSLGVEENFTQALKREAEARNWPGVWIVGGGKNGDGYSAQCALWTHNPALRSKAREIYELAKANGVTCFLVEGAENEAP